MSENIKKLLFTNSNGELFSVTLGIDGVPIDASTIAYISRDNRFTGIINFDNKAYVSNLPSELNEIANKQYVDEQIEKFIPSGTIRCYAGKTVPEGYLLCNGQSFNILEYPNLFSAIGYTYGGSGNTANVPNINDRTIWGTTNVNNVGTMLEDGLPNGIGSLAANLSGGSSPWVPNTSEGALYNNGNSQSYDGNAIDDTITRSNDVRVRLDLSKSNSIYGSSLKVQPRAAQFLMIIKS